MAVITSGRWKGKSQRHVREQMRDIARQRMAKLSPEQKKRIARKLVKARGAWIKNDEGKKIYVRAK